MFYLGDERFSKKQRAHAEKCALHYIHHSSTAPLFHPPTHPPCCLCRELAEESGIPNWGRVPALNTNATFIQDLADAVLEALPYCGSMAASDSTDGLVPLGAHRRGDGQTAVAAAAKHAGWYGVVCFVVKCGGGRVAVSATCCWWWGSGKVLCAGPCSTSPVPWRVPPSSFLTGSSLAAVARQLVSAHWVPIDPTLHWILTMDPSFDPMPDLRWAPHSHTHGAPQSCARWQL